ncbi:UNVERIFIED_CONTAM: hypothetical protein K2H54_067640 [Gekko kuhli]
MALRDELHQRRTEIRAPVSVERRVAVTVWWMANNMSYRAVAHQFGLVQSTVAGIVVEVTRAITERLLERVVYLHDSDKARWQCLLLKLPCALRNVNNFVATCVVLHNLCAERGHAVPDVRPEGGTDDGLLEYEGPEGQRDCDHHGAGLQVREALTTLFCRHARIQ